MTRGTAYFVSRNAAFGYYAAYESDPARAVTRKLEAGEIHIGKPPLRPGEELILLDDGRRYGITDDKS